MSLSIYDLAVVPFLDNLKILSTLLEKGRLHVADNEESLTTSRLIADMGDLVFQVQRVSDTVKGFAVRVGNAEPVVMEDNEKTFADLQERIAKTIKLVETLTQDNFVGREGVEVVMKTRTGERIFTGATYVTKHAVPNFYFHLCMVYALLRKEGVQVGKSDYLGIA